MLRGKITSLVRLGHSGVCSGFTRGFSSSHQAASASAVRDMLSSTNCDHTRHDQVIWTFCADHDRVSLASQPVVNMLIDGNFVESETNHFVDVTNPVR